MRRARENKNNRFSAQWIVRVCLAMPTQSARAFAQSHADLVGRGRHGMGRATISKIRDAFVEVCKEMNGKEIEYVESLYKS